MKRLVAGLLTLLLLCGFTFQAPKPNPDPLDLNPVLNAFRFDGVETTVVWRTCRQLNAFYYPTARRVVLCNELRRLEPGAIRYILAHELAHGVIMQLDVPYTTHHEGAADELAALMLIWMGREADVVDGALFWAGMGRPENPFDDHFGDWRRANNLICLVEGSLDDGLVETGCIATYRRATRAWVKLLHMD